VRFTAGVTSSCLCKKAEGVVLPVFILLCGLQVEPAPVKRLKIAQMKIAKMIRSTEFVARHNKTYTSPFFTLTKYGAS
jgi:hypothetical protein